jgi:hypothetical protein
MTDSQGGEAAIVETNAGAEGAPVSSERDYETEAREGGWRPQEEWTGKPDKWKDAKTWVENSDLPTRIRNEVKAEYEERFARLEKMGKKAQDAIRNGYEQQIADLKAERSAAIKKGDEKAVEQYDTAIEKVKEAAKDDGTGPDDADVEAAFVKRNEWYGTDEELTAIAERESRKVLKEYAEKFQKDNPGKPVPPLSYEKNLAEVERRVKASALWKSRNEKPAANGHAAVDGGSDNPGSAPSKSPTFDKLQPEAKKQFAADVKAGIYKSSESEDWAKAYFS